MVHLGNELKSIYTLWLREIKRFYRQKSRIVGMIMQPLLFLFIIGTGVSTAFASRGNFDYLQFMYPGIICMSLLFTSFFSGISIIIDRQFGFLKEVMVAPISRVSIALGKTLGGSTVALFQGIILLLLAPILGIQLDILLVLKLIPVMLLITFSLTSLGILFAVPMESMEGFQMIMSFIVMPMFFLSGAFFPMEGVPGWLTILMRMDPLTYGVDALRNIFFTGTQGQMMLQYSLQFNILVLFGFGIIIHLLAVAGFTLKKE